MLKSIKVSQEVYNALDRARADRETFGETIARLLMAYAQLLKITRIKP